MVRRPKTVPSRASATIATLMSMSIAMAAPTSRGAEPASSTSGMPEAPPPAASASSAGTDAPHAPDGRRVCVAAYEDHQVLRRQGQLLESRQVLSKCIQTSCPAFVRIDCSNWLLDVERAIPTVLVSVQVDGHDRLDAAVEIDGVARTDALGGKPLELNPGPHVVRVRVRDRATEERTVVLKEGDKLRAVTINYETPAPPPAPRRQTERPTPRGVWALAGVGALGLGVFVTAGAIGQSKRHGLEQTCKPFCTDAELAPVRTAFAIADVALGVSFVSLSTATIWYLLRPEHTVTPKSGRAAVELACVPSTDGLRWVAQGEF